jgi:hypothetical protein
MGRFVGRKEGWRPQSFQWISPTHSGAGNPSAQLHRVRLGLRGLIGPELAPDDQSTLVLAEAADGGIELRHRDMLHAEVIPNFLKRRTDKLLAALELAKDLVTDERIALLLCCHFFSQL